MSDATGTRAHRASAPSSVRTAVLTVSDTRSLQTDESGAYLARELAAAGHELIERAIVPDEPGEIRARLVGWIADERVQVVLSTGGTGIARRDGTVEVVQELLEKPLPGFGELFRMLSYQQVGGAAILSRAVAGVADGTLLIAMPGSLNAVQTAWEGILRDELGHLVGELTR